RGDRGSSPPPSCRRRRTRGAFLGEASADDTDEVAAFEQAARLDRETVERLRRDADVGEEQLTDESARPCRDQSALRQGQRDGERGADRYAEGLAGIRMQARGNVDREDRQVRRVRGANQVGERA